MINAAAKLVLMSFAVFCTYGRIRLQGVTAIALATMGIGTSAFLSTIVAIWGDFRQAFVKARKTLNTYSVHDDDGYEPK